MRGLIDYFIAHMEGEGESRPTRWSLSGRFLICIELRWLTARGIRRCVE